MADEKVGRHNSPWRKAMREYQRAHLPPPLEGLERLLRIVVDEDRGPSGRLDAAATMLLRLQAWFDGFAAEAKAIEATLGLDAAGILDVARQTEALRAAGHDNISIDHTVHPPVVRAMTADELERLTASLAEIRAEEGTTEPTT
jgi:hypothetical protein